MKGIILSFRRGRHTQNNKQVILLVESDKENLIGRKVVVKYKNKRIIGKIVRKFGTKENKYLAMFKKGLSGNILSQEVEIV